MYSSTLSLDSECVSLLCSTRMSDLTTVSPLNSLRTRNFPFPSFELDLGRRESDAVLGQVWSYDVNYDSSSPLAGITLVR